MLTPDQIQQMTAKERLDLIDALWLSLSPDDLRLTPEQAAELDRRLETFEEDAAAAVPWEVVKAELARRGS
ncbi:MAG TPA: addiction module protein [Chloroflexota bacterium]|nr:addiction module protein [Chloroflexota bacterium]